MSRSSYITSFLLLLSTSCAATTIRSGRPPADPAPGYDERWDSSFFFGAVAASKPYELARICPTGWSQVTLGRDPFTLLASVLSLFIYSPSRVTVICATPGSSGLPPVEGYAPNALPASPNPMPSSPTRP
jgi:hypothetical protein